MKTTSLELSKKLKEAGFPQESTFTYVKDFQTREYKLASFQDPWHGAVTNYYAAGRDDVDHPMFAAPTAEEILERLPAMHKGHSLTIGRSGNGQNWNVAYLYENWAIDNAYGFASDNLAEAAGKMYLYLKENNLLKGVTDQ
jgi:hypothetical protein